MNWETNANIFAALRRDVNVGLQRPELVHRSEQRGDRDTVTFAHRNVADDSSHGCCHTVVVQFYLLLIYLFAERFELSESRVTVGLSIIKFLLAHNASFKELAFALKLRLGITKIRFLRGTA